MNSFTYIPKENPESQFGEISNGCYEEKKSKFYSYIFKINNIEEVQRHIYNVKKSNKEARHIVYAYSLGDYYKYSDDGEPSGTAGRMIYSIIAKQKITNNLIIVVRYFGGTLLGVGNLARAYLKSTKLAIDKCNVEKIKETEKIYINLNFDEENLIREKIKDINGEILNIKYNGGVNMEVCIPKSNKNIFQKWLQKSSNV